MKYRVGLVGAGENARDHGRACHDSSQVEMVAICDISEVALERFGNEFNISQRYTNLEEMLDNESLDIVIVSTWGVFHAEISNAVSRSGKVKAILVEKPISATATECEEMISLANENDVLLAEAFKWRHDPQHLRVKEILDSGRIGDVVSVHAIFSSPLVRFATSDNWRYDRKRGGGSVYDTAGYIIHFSRFVMGLEPERVSAVGVYTDDADVEMAASIMLQFPGGKTAQLTSSYLYGYCQATQVLGTNGWMRLDVPFDQRSVREQEFVEKEDLPGSIHVFFDDFNTEVYQFSPVNQFDLQLTHLIDSIEKRVSHRIPPEFSMGNMRVVEAIFESMKTGQPVDIQA